jgi:hypothetical protein
MNELEDRLREILRGQAELAGQSDRRSESVLRRAQSVARGRRRPRRIAAAVLALGSCLVGFGVTRVVRSNDAERSRTLVLSSENDFDPDFRLIPTWLPPDAPSPMYVETASSAVRLDGSAIVWRSGRRQFVLIARMAEGETSSSSVQSGIDRARQRGDETGVVWTVALANGKHVQLLASGLPARGLEPFLGRVTVDGEGLLGPIDPPAPGFTEYFKGPASALDPTQAWTAVFVDYPAQIGAVRYDGAAADVIGGFAVTGKATTVRGLPATASSFDPTTTPGSTAASISWAEKGWTVTVSAADEETARRIAENLAVGASDEWTQRVRQSASGLGLEVSGTDFVGLMEEGQQQITARVSRVANDTGCVPIAFKVGALNTDACVPTDGGSLLWSRMVQFDGGTVALLAVRHDVDAVVPVAGGATEKTSESVDTKSVDESVPTVMIVRVGDRYEGLGLVAVPLDLDGAQGLVDLFRADVDPEPVEPDPSADEADPKPRLVRIERASVPCRDEC